MILDVTSWNAVGGGDQEVSARQAEETTTGVTSSQSILAASFSSRSGTTRCAALGYDLY